MTLPLPLRYFGLNIFTQMGNKRRRFHWTCAWRRTRTASHTPSTLYCVPNHFSLSGHWPSCSGDKSIRLAFSGVRWERAAVITCTQTERGRHKNIIARKKNTCKARIRLQSLMPLTSSAEDRVRKDSGTNWGFDNHLHVRKKETESIMFFNVWVTHFINTFA